MKRRMIEGLQGFINIVIRASVVVDGLDELCKEMSKDSFDGSRILMIRRMNKLQNRLIISFISSS